MYFPFRQVIVRKEERRIFKSSSVPPETRRAVRLFGRFNLVNERARSVRFLESLFL